MKYLNKIVPVLFCPFALAAQNYSAVNGSLYTGSLSVHNNPSSIVNTPMKFDLAVLGVQDKHTTNVVKVFKYSLLSNPKGSQYLFEEGDFSRYANVNLNINLLNTRIAISRKRAIAFGANFKSYLFGKTSPYHFIDTISQFAHFFSLNEGKENMRLDLFTSSWAELYASYGQTVFEDASYRLNAGVTLKINRGLSGAFAKLANGNFLRTGSSNPVIYEATAADIDFGYSSNYDLLNDNKTSRENFNDFVSFTETGFSFDAGVEFLIKPTAADYPEEEESFFDYDWKIGVSALDIGYGQYHFGRYSIGNRVLFPGTTDPVLDSKFDSTITGLGPFKDSLSTLYQFPGTYAGKFRITHPSRLVLNVDRFITDAFFINADISFDLSLATTNKDQLRVKDMNLLTITPRWETKKKAFYLPVHLNNYNQLWAGGAVRIGPVLFGVHNWSNIFSKNKITRGGGYIAILLRASDITGRRADKRFACPD